MVEKVTDPAAGAVQLIIGLLQRFSRLIGERDCQLLLFRFQQIIEPSNTGDPLIQRGRRPGSLPLLQGQKFFPHGGFWIFLYLSYQFFRSRVDDLHAIIIWYDDYFILGYPYSSLRYFLLSARKRSLIFI